MGAPCTSRMCNCRLNQRSRPSRRETTPHSRRETQCLRVVSTCETPVWPDLCPCPPSHGIPRHLTISHPHLIVQREERPNESRSSTQLGTRFDFPENLLPLPSWFHRKLLGTQESIHPKRQFKSAQISLQTLEISKELLSHKKKLKKIKKYQLLIQKQKM